MSKTDVAHRTPPQSVCVVSAPGKQLQEEWSGSEQGVGFASFTNTR